MTHPLWLFGTQLSILTDETESASLYDFIEGTIPAGVETPLHLHKNYSEFIYLLQGEITIYTNAHSVILHPGETFLIPKGTQHVVAATGAEAAKALTIASPSGFAKLIRALASSEPSVDPMDPQVLADFMQISAEIGDEIIGPPGSRPK